MEPLDETVRMAQACDAAGFDTFWLAEAYPSVAQALDGGVTQSHRRGHPRWASCCNAGYAVQTPWIARGIASMISWPHHGTRLFPAFGSSRFFH